MWSGQREAYVGKERMQDRARNIYESQIYDVGNV